MRRTTCNCPFVVKPFVSSPCCPKNCQGATGATGVGKTGPTGATGIGSQGATGATGIGQAGATGIGATGATGIGNIGPTGATGVGATGIGATGATGVGNTGATGMQGLPGQGTLLTFFSSDQTIGSQPIFIGLGNQGSFEQVSLVLPQTVTFTKMAAKINPTTAGFNFTITVYINCTATSMTMSYTGAGDPNWTINPNCPNLLCRAVSGSITFNECDLISVYTNGTNGNSQGVSVTLSG